MRILHTSDWHIGHRLYERNRNDEHRQFLEWLLATIREKGVDVLLVAGDIFDTALPSSEATDLYYQFLFRLYSETAAHAVITAGNHDAPVRLAAPRQFLKMGRIHVIGSVDQGVDDCIITLHSHAHSPLSDFSPNPSHPPLPLQGGEWRGGESSPPSLHSLPLQGEGWGGGRNAGESAVVIAAVPYLSENELLPHVSLETEVEKAGRYREVVKQFYQRCVERMPEGIPKILMGHLVVQGAQESGSERVIQIGGALPVRAVDLPEGVDYVALGHLHRPQSINGANYPIRYAGSPLPMTFKEASYSKKVYLLDLDKSGEERLTEITIPTFKELCRVRGSYEQVMFDAMAADREWRGKYIEVQLILNAPQLGVGDEIREAFGVRGGDVLLVEVQLAEGQREADLSAEDISAKSPEEIFEEFYRATYNTEAEDDTHFAEMMETFKELLHMTSTETEEKE